MTNTITKDEYWMLDYLDTEDKKWVRSSFLTDPQVMVLLIGIRRRNDGSNIRVQRETDLDKMVDENGREFSPIHYEDWNWEGAVTKREFLFGTQYQQVAEKVRNGELSPDDFSPFGKQDKEAA
jgi:hypothetical protein